MDAPGEVEKADWLGGTRRPVPGGRYKRLSLAHNPASAPTCDQDKARPPRPPPPFTRVANRSSDASSGTLASRARGDLLRRVTSRIRIDLAPERHPVIVRAGDVRPHPPLLLIEQRRPRRLQSSLVAVEDSLGGIAVVQWKFRPPHACSEADPV